jgi:hypothetical protein
MRGDWCVKGRVCRHQLSTTYARRVSANVKPVENDVITVATTDSHGGKDEERKPWKWEESADAQRAYGVLALVLAAGTTPWLQEQKNASVFYFVALAVCTIYIGAHKGLTNQLKQQISVREVRRSALLPSTGGRLFAPSDSFCIVLYLMR